MQNKVIAISADKMLSLIESEINAELEKGWLVELFYEARGFNGNTLIVTLYKE